MNIVTSLLKEISDDEASSMSESYLSFRKLYYDINNREMCEAPVFNPTSVIRAAAADTSSDQRDQVYEGLKKY